MKFSNIILILALGISLACTQKNSKRDPIAEFQLEESISSYSLQSADSLFKVEDMILFKDVLIVLDLGLDFFYKIVDVNSDQFLKKFGKRGEGPNEFLTLTYINHTSGNLDLIGINESQKQVFKEYLLDSILQAKGDPSPYSITEGFDHMHIAVAKIDSAQFVGYGFFEKPFTQISVNQTINNIGSFPFRDELKNNSSQTLVMAYQSRFYKNPKKPLMLSSSSFSFNMDFLRIDSNEKLVVYKSLRFWPTEFEDESSGGSVSAAIRKENRFGNLSTTVSGEFIYVLYQEKPWEYEFPQKSNRILVYDWEGNAVKILNLDKELNYIAVHEDDQYLIGYVDDGKANLYRFDLK
jgi:hypothetical protein